MHKTQLVFYSEAQILGGAERYLSTLIEGLDRNIFDIHVVFSSIQFQEEFFKKFPCSVNSARSVFKSQTSSKRIFRRRKLPRYFGPLLYLRSELRRWYRYLFASVKLYSVLKGMKIDILHINSGGYPAAEGLRAAVLVGKLLHLPKIVMTVHNLAVPRKFSVIDRVGDFFVFRSTQLICVSEAVKKTLIDNRGAPDSVLKVIYNGVAEWTSCNAEGDSLRSQLGIPHDSMIVIMVATFEERKGHVYLLKAAEEVVKRTKNVFFLVVGDYLEGNGTEVISMAEALGLKDYFLFTGFRKDARALIAISNLLVLCSLEYESFGLVLVEAMTQGLPVIGTRIGGVPEVVLDGINGLLVPPGDFLALAAAIQSLLSDRRLSAEMGRKGRELFESRFSVPRMVDKVNRVYFAF